MPGATGYGKVNDALPGPKWLNNRHRQDHAVAAIKAGPRRAMKGPSARQGFTLAEASTRYTQDHGHQQMSHPTGTARRRFQGKPGA